MVKKVKLALSALLSAAGLTGFVIVMKKGVVGPNIISPGDDYVMGWSLFFFLVLGLPCLGAFFVGLIPWIGYLRERKSAGRGKPSGA